MLMSPWDFSLFGGAGVRGTLLVLCALVARAVVVTPMPTSALHWQVDVFYGPTTVPMESTQTFSIRLRNDGPDPVAVSRVAVTFDWVASGYVYVVSDQVFNLAPANDRTLTLTVEIPRLVQDSVHAVTIFVTAETSGDLMAEQKEYNGEITVTAAIPAATDSLLFVGLGVLVAIIVVVLF